METLSFTSDFNPDSLRGLPKDIQEKVLIYIRSLMMEKESPKWDRKFSFDWEGGLSEIRQDFSSVELQHLANDLR